MGSQLAAATATPLQLHPDGSGSAAAAKTLDDTTLVERMAAGDAAALEELHSRHAAILEAFVLRMLHNPEDAQDAVQEAFAQAWRLAARYRRNLSSVSTWLGMMARSRALDRIRRRRNRPELQPDPDGRELSAMEPARGTERVLQAQRRARVRAELARIPPCQRKVLELRFWEGLTQSEIAEQIGIPLGTVKTRTLLALRKLREGLANEAHELL